MELGPYTGHLSTLDIIDTDISTDITHSLFHPGLKRSFSANPSHCSPSFLLLKYSLHGFPRVFTVISEHICFLLLFFSVFTLFSCRFRAVE